MDSSEKKRREDEWTEEERLADKRRKRKKRGWREMNGRVLVGCPGVHRDRLSSCMLQQLGPVTRAECLSLVY